MGSLPLESSDYDQSAAGSSSKESGTCSLSEGRLSPSNSCMSGRVTLR
jgi:hypothetical protein